MYLFIVKDLAQLVVKRATLLNHILPQQETGSDSFGDAVLTAMVGLFYDYLKKAQQPSDESYPWVCNVLCGIININIYQISIQILCYHKNSEFIKT
jgi:hypothetical protein